jgi:hypothetical protein
MERGLVTQIPVIEKIFKDLEGLEHEGSSGRFLPYLLTQENEVASWLSVRGFTLQRQWQIQNSITSINFYLHRICCAFEQRNCDFRKRVREYRRAQSRNFSRGRRT